MQDLQTNLSSFLAPKMYPNYSEDRRFKGFGTDLASMKGKCPRSLKANTRVRPSDHSYLAGQILTMEDVQRLCAAVVPLSEVVGVNHLLRGEGQPWVGERCPLVLMVNIQNLEIGTLLRPGYTEYSAILHIKHPTGF